MRGWPKASNDSDLTRERNNVSAAKRAVFASDVFVLIVHNSHRLYRFCTEFCVLFVVREGHRLVSVEGDCDGECDCTGFGAFWMPQSRACQACFALSTAKLAEFRE